MPHLPVSANAAVIHEVFFFFFLTPTESSNVHFPTLLGASETVVMLLKATAKNFLFQLQS